LEPFDQDLAVEERGGRGSPAIEVFRRGTALEIVDGEATVDGDDEGDADDVQRRTVNSRVMSASTLASCDDDEQRLEAGAASGGDDDTDLLRFWTREGHQSELQREGNKTVQERGRGEASLHRNRRGFGRCPAEFRREIGVTWRRKSRGKGRGTREEDEGILNGGFWRAVGLGSSGEMGSERGW
jgi:hypothetical protein